MTAPYPGPGALPVPELDDRTFLDLVAEARQRAAQSCPTWTDLSVHDPGMALIEVFAYLTEVMLYRLNRLPEKAYLTFLNLIGLTRHPPAAAWVDLTFSRAADGKESSEPISIPAGTRVASARGTEQPVVFVTTDAVVLPPSQNEITIRAHHCELVEAELIGKGTGQPGQRFTTSKAPIVRTNEQIDLLLGVQITPSERVEGIPAREHGGMVFEIWQPVPSFAGLTPGAKVYLVDRASGTVTFAPALDLRGGSNGALPAVPAAGREIRLWSRTGGGAAGNVAAGTLTSLVDRISGLKVTNNAPARGGRELEDIQAAIARGPYEFFSQQRALTAHDYELLATAGSAGVARAKAFTRVTVRPFARPGEVEVVLVPHVPDRARPAGRLPLRTLIEHQVEEARLRTQTDLDARQALGTSCIATWANYKEVSIRGRVVVRPEEDPDAVRNRINDRLHQTISALPTQLNPSGWPFGEPLRASNVYRMLEQAEPGVRYVDDIRFVVAEAPDEQVRTVAADPFQRNTWYAGAGELLFRSTNQGAGWESVGRFSGEQVRRVLPAPRPIRPGMIGRPGTIALITRRADGTGSGVYLSTDLGESWRRIAELQTGIVDVAWIDRDRNGALLLASDTGLYELALLPDATPNQIIVEPSDPDRGFYAVEAFISEQGNWGVAVAAQAQLGVYLSVQGGRRGTFGNIGLTGTETRCMSVQFDGPTTVLWVGTGEPDPKRPGPGCVRARLFEADVRWENLSIGWAGGTCWEVGFAGSTALAATQSAGVLGLDTSANQPTWRTPDVNCGLPLRDLPRFDAVLTVAADSAGGLAMAGGARGVYRSRDGLRWQATANRETTDAVTIPDTWLLCSGEHQIEVVGGYASADN